MRKVVGGAIAMTILLAGCGSKTDANEKNFGAAIVQYLDKKGELCLNITKWPVDVNEMDLLLQKSMPTGTAGRMVALEAVGLAKGVDTELEGAGFDGKPNGVKFKVKRYTLTDAAKPFERQKDVEHIGLNGRIKEVQTDLCWGKMALDKVVKWEGPMKFGDYQEASVKYQYKIEGLADWAKKPEFLTAFPHVAQIAEDAGKKEQQQSVKLTSVSWEANGLDN
ncbi:hypothetical protein [Paraherbaspirillum soli]|uniref:Lipoprotein n=1 Tax=Paraherbaspirillum soli TaxID=631222 RepID=A0ABW0M9T9_9BURK